MQYTQQFLIAQQSYQQQQYNQSYLYLYKKQNKIQTYIPQQFTILTQKQKQNEDQIQQFISLPHIQLQQSQANTQKLYPVQTIKNIRQKILDCFTDYIQKCMERFENVQFVGVGFKRYRKVEIYGQELLRHYIDVNQLLTNQEIKCFQNIIRDFFVIKSVLIELIPNLIAQYRDQLIFILFKIISSLLHCKDNSKLSPNYSSNSQTSLNTSQLSSIDLNLYPQPQLTQNLANLTNIIIQNIKSSQKLSKIVFTYYTNDHNEVDNYFTQMLTNWINIFTDLVKDNLNQYQDDISEQKDEQFKCTESRKFVFSIKVDNDDNQDNNDEIELNKSLSQPRKIKSWL